MDLRPYQTEAMDATDVALSAYRSTLLVMATGTGKTRVFATIASRWPVTSGRVLILAHRRELIMQAYKTCNLFAPGEVEIEMDTYRATHSSSVFGECGRIVVASKDSLFRSNRLNRYNPDDFGLVIADEAHHFTKSNITYWQILKRFEKAKLLGVTATPDRHDGEAMGGIFESVAYVYDIKQAVDDAWLVPVQQQMLVVDGLDLSSVKVSRKEKGEKDFLPEDLDNVMKQEGVVHGIVNPVIELANHGGQRRQVLFFATSVAQAKLMANICNRSMPGSAVALSGDDERDLRDEQIKRYANGEFQFLCGCALFCLDERTEILTRVGWVGIDEMTNEHEVANWDDGRIWFSKHKGLVRRLRMVGEDMYSVMNDRVSIRVTGNHRMLVRSGRTGKFRICTADSVAGRRINLPISGQADVEEFESSIDSMGNFCSNPERRVSANAYSLRKIGWSYQDSFVEAERRQVVRDCLRRTPVELLTADECRFIGFYLAEGCKVKLQKGGVEYKIVQSKSYQHIIDWFDCVLERMGVHFKRRDCSPPAPGSLPVVCWSFCRGTGGGSQHRAGGLYRLEKYLNKSGVDEFWGLDQERFDALIEGLHFGDGYHGDGLVIPECKRILGKRKKLFDLLQAIACCRGYRASVRMAAAPVESRHTQLYILSLTKESSVSLHSNFLEKEQGWLRERVWCVTSESGNIIVRRNGFVVVVGNSEGFDEPRIRIVVPKPTMSRASYAQQIGRGTRTWPGTLDERRCHTDLEYRRQCIRSSTKPSLLVVDPYGTSGKHKLVTTLDILGGNFSPEAVARAKEQLTSGDRERGECLAELRRAQMELEFEEEQRRRDIVLKARYSLVPVDPFEMFDVRSTKCPNWLRGKYATRKQLDYILSNSPKGTKLPPDLSLHDASTLIESIKTKKDAGPPSEKMAATLQRFGYPPVATYTEAKAIIEQLAANGWKKPVPVTADSGD